MTRIVSQSSAKKNPNLRALHMAVDRRYALHTMHTHTSDTLVLAGVMGWPVFHSRSPVIHGHWIKQLGLRGNYVPLAVNPVLLPQALGGLSALGFAGCNLTLPHKVDALAHVHQLDDVARQIGAVNTVMVNPDGSLRGHQHGRLRLPTKFARSATPLASCTRGCGGLGCRWCSPCCGLGFGRRGCEAHSLAQPQP